MSTPNSAILSFRERGHSIGAAFSCGGARSSVRGMEVIMHSESLRDVVARLSASATVLAALGAVMRARVSGSSIHPTLQPHVDALLQHAGVHDAVHAAAPEEVAPLLAELRHFWLLDDELVRHPERAAGWTSADPDLLDSAGEVTRGFPHALARFAPQLDGLAVRLEAPGAAFLDVGVGVGHLAIAMARRWHHLRVLGVDPFAPALARARDRVAAAQLGDRVELSAQPVEDLADEAAFDLAWVPAPFIPDAVMCRVIARVRDALKPGGWLLVAVATSGEDLRGAAMSLRVARFGGRAATRDEVFALLHESGLTDIRALPSPPRDFKIVVAARRSA